MSRSLAGLRARARATLRHGTCSDRRMLLTLTVLLSTPATAQAVTLWSGCTSPRFAGDPPRLRDYLCFLAAARGVEFVPPADDGFWRPMSVLTDATLTEAEQIVAVEAALAARGLRLEDHPGGARVAGALRLDALDPAQFVTQVVRSEHASAELVERLRGEPGAPDLRWEGDLVVLSGPPVAVARFVGRFGPQRDDPRPATAREVEPMHALLLRPRPDPRGWYRDEEGPHLVDLGDPAQRASFGGRCRASVADPGSCDVIERFACPPFVPLLAGDTEGARVETLPSGETLVTPCRYCTCERGELALLPAYQGTGTLVFHVSSSVWYGCDGRCEDRLFDPTTFVLVGSLPCSTRSGDVWSGPIALPPGGGRRRR